MRITGAPGAVTAAVEVSRRVQAAERRRRIKRSDRFIVKEGSPSPAGEGGATAPGEGSCPSGRHRSPHPAASGGHLLPREKGFLQKKSPRREAGATGYCNKT